MYFSMRASVTGLSPRVRRPVKPVETPNTMRPGASAFSVASPEAVTGAIRLEGMMTPAQSLIRLVFTAAAPIAAKTSALSSTVS